MTEGIAVCYEVNNDAASVGYTAHSLGTLRAAREAGSDIPDVWVITAGALTEENRGRITEAYAGVRLFDAKRLLTEAKGEGLRIEARRGDEGRDDVLMLRLLMPLMPWAADYGVQFHLDGDTEVVDADKAFVGLAGMLDGYRDVAGACEVECAKARFGRALATMPDIPAYPALWNAAAGNYMNAGVYALDLERVRQLGDWKGRVRAMCAVASDIRSTLPDQDAMNLMLHILPAPCAYNAFAETGWKEGDVAYVRHYPGAHKGELNRKMCPHIE